MKRILIDASFANNSDGTGRVTYNFTKSLLLTDTKNHYSVIMYKKDFLPDLQRSNIEKILSRWSGRGQIRAVWYLCILPFILFKKHITIFYSFENFSTPFFFFGKTILTIHDLIPIKEKYYYRKFLNRIWFKLRVWNSTRKTREAIVVSKYSEKEFLIYFPNFLHHTHVIYNALDTRFQNEQEQESLPDHLLSKKYLFATGGFEKRKNNILTIKAFAELCEQDLNFQLDLVIIGVGNKAYKNAQHEIVTIPKNIQKRVHILNYVNDTMLALLYHHAYAFIFPSLYEGFGMPILEAMHAGVPVIAMQGSSLPEAGGDACLYIQNDAESLKKAMQLLLSNTELYNKLIRQGYDHVKTFSWDKGAQEIIGIIASL